MIILKPFNIFNWNVRITLLHRVHDLDKMNEDKCADGIIQSVSHNHGVSPDIIRGKSRKQQHVKARWEVAYKLRTEVKLSFVRIGEILNRDHTTIIHSLEKYKYENNLLS